MKVSENSNDLMEVGEKPSLSITEGFHGLPPNDCGIENATALGKCCTKDTIVLTQSRQYHYTTMTKI